MVACAQDKSQKAAYDRERQSPLDLRAEIARPENGEGDDTAWHSGSESEPRQTILIRKTTSALRGALHQKESQLQSLRAHIVEGAGKMHCDLDRVLQRLCARCHRFAPALS